MSYSRFGLYIGRLFGIRFYLDSSWFLIAAIVVYSLAVEVFPTMLRDRSAMEYFLMGAGATLIFFASILLHELGHSIVSQRCGIPVPRITLLFIGGIAEISREPDTAGCELKIALGGPVVSAVLVGFYALLAYIFHRAGMAAGRLMFEWLAGVNFTLIVFNAIPGYPLDGGRVLRALIWARTGNLRRATFITTRIGVTFSWLLIGLGVIRLFNHEWDAFVLLLIGLFLKNAAESGYTQTLYHEVLAGVRVLDIMTRDPVCVPADMPLSLVVDEIFLANHHVAFPVVSEEREFRGLLRIEFLKELPREKWAFTRAGDLTARHDAEKLSIEANQPADRALRRLLVAGLGRLAVLEGNKVAGIITRHDILHFIKIHTELEG